MLQIAVFVDAGYLYAQGSALLAGQKQPRTAIQLDVPAALDQITNTAKQVAPTERLLRIYWYDGILRGGRLTTEQTEIANSPNVKLRLGMVNSRGEQKGVDSLIVTDLIDLARNQAISDALIVSGDEDIRVGVLVAQTFGVRTHLLGIKPARGSQSLDLIQEADTHHEWADDVVRPWMKVQAVPIAVTPVGSSLPRVQRNTQPQEDQFDASAVAESKATISTLDASQLKQIVDHLDPNRNQIPPEVDRLTLARLRNRLGRDLTDAERKRYRTIFASELRSATPTS